MLLQLVQEDLQEILKSFEGEPYDERTIEILSYQVQQYLDSIALPWKFKIVKKPENKLKVIFY